MRFPHVDFPERVTPVQQKPRIAFLSSFPPRQCGIATFTSDLLSAVETATDTIASAVAMNDQLTRYAYDARVTLQIERNDRASYTAAAARLAQMPIDVINVQHEYGLFGGVWGDYLLRLYAASSLPIVTTLHSVIPNPDAVLRRVTRELIDSSAHVVVLANAATKILNRDYGIAQDKIRMIPHGIPSVNRSAHAQRATQVKLGLEGRMLLSTFGLLSPNKGIEVAIRALPAIVAAHPDVLYLVIGQTHPGVRAHEGEAYRLTLQNLVHELHLQAHVVFVDQYLSLPQLLEYLIATDIYVIPYLNPTQIVSGTLAYAMGCGKAVVSTPFIHACEVLSDGHGVLVPFKDSVALSQSINTLLGDATARNAMALRAYARSRGWTWSAVANQYATLYKEVTQLELPHLVL